MVEIILPGLADGLSFDDDGFAGAKRYIIPSRQFIGHDEVHVDDAIAHVGILQGVYIDPCIIAEIAVVGIGQLFGRDEHIFLGEGNRPNGEGQGIDGVVGDMGIGTVTAECFPEEVIIIPLTNTLTEIDLNTDRRQYIQLERDDRVTIGSVIMNGIVVKAVLIEVSFRSVGVVAEAVVLIFVDGYLQMLDDGEVETMGRKALSVGYAGRIESRVIDAAIVFPFAVP